MEEKDYSALLKPIGMKENKAKEKAKELVDKHYKELTKDYADNDLAEIFANSMWYKESKQCALICVEEIISACEYNHVESFNTDWWNEVKEEINKL